MLKTFDELRSSIPGSEPRIIAVAAAEDAEVLIAVHDARQKGIADSILIGDAKEILKIAEGLNIDLRAFIILDEKDKEKACLSAVELVSSGKAHMLMKGLVDTSVLLKAALNKKTGLRTGKVLSHVAIFSIKGYDRFIYVTDAAMNIAPDAEHKLQIIENAVSVAHALGNRNPKVALLAAVEKVNPHMKATLDAEEIIRAYEGGRLQGCTIGGPFALDIAVSAEAAAHKGIEHPVAGKSDILLVPSIEAGNVLYKSIVYFSGGENAGIVLGAKAPIVLTSRSDSHEAKLNSIALGVLAAAAKNNTEEK
ncbi:phosphate butyryltransferase [Bacillota bacterium]